MEMGVSPVKRLDGLEEEGREADVKEVDLSPLLDIKEVCAYLKVGQTIVREMIRRGELPHIRIRSRIRVSLLDLQRYLERQRRGAGV
jgi:excisionase family DNA binding protein